MREYINDIYWCAILTANMLLYSILLLILSAGIIIMNARLTYEQD